MAEIDEVTVVRKDVLWAIAPLGTVFLEGRDALLAEVGSKLLALILGKQGKSRGADGVCIDR